MYKIAIKMLVRNKAKFYAMVFGIASCALMMAQQPAIFMGIMVRVYSVVSDIPQADVWVVKTGVKELETAIPLRYNDFFRVRSMPYVKWAVPFYRGMQRVQLNSGEYVAAVVIGVDDISLIGLPESMIEGNKEDIKKPDAVFLDNNFSYDKLYKVKTDGTKEPFKIGDYLELNERRRIVAGRIENNPNLMSDPTIYTTYSSAVRSSQYERNSLTAILVKVSDEGTPEQVADYINHIPGFNAYTRQQFANSSFNELIEKSSIMQSFSIGIGFIFIVSIIIISTIFHSFVSENIRSLAVLKAMGLDDQVLVKMTMLQAAVSGVIGFSIGIGAASVFGALIGGVKVGYRLMPQMVIFSAITIAVICFISVYIALKRIMQAEPAMVFKGN